MAFNVMSQYDTFIGSLDLQMTQIDADGRLDMVVLSDRGLISVRLGKADGTFGPTLYAAPGDNPRSLATGDFTGDGITDLVTANSAGVGLLKGNGNGTFQSPTSISLPGVFPPVYTDPTPHTQGSLSVATGDLNGDGKLDLVVGGNASFSTFGGCGYYYGYYSCYDNNYSDGYVNVLLGNGAGGFSPAEVHDLGTSRLPYALAVDDINGDGRADVITANNSDLSVLLGDGTGAVGDPISSGSGNQLHSISLGDVDGDGNVDTILGTGDGLRVQKGDGLGSFTAQPPLGTGGWLNSAAIGDVNADGKLDLVALSAIHDFVCTAGTYPNCYSGHSTTTAQATVLLGNGAGAFASPLKSQLGSTKDGSGYLPGVALADLTGDGLPELVVADYYQQNVIVAANNGNWGPQPAIVISDASVGEGNSGTTSATFTVTLVGAHSGSVSVDYATANKTAVAGTDYTAKSGTVTFGPGESTKMISVPVRGDTISENDEQFYVNLSNAVGGQVTDGQGIGTIVDDDAAPLIKISDVTKNEGNNGTTSFVFAVSLSAASGKQVSVNFATADGTATATGNDYFAASGTVVFAPGQTSAAITIVVRGDTTKEASETFFVNLTGAANAAISDSQGLGTIGNDDGATAGGGKQKLSSSNLAALFLADDTWTTTGKRR